MANEALITPEGRVLFQAVFTPWKGRNAKPDAKAKYTLALAFAEGADLKALRKAAEDCAKAKWGASMPRGLSSPFIEYKDYEHEDFKPGMVLIRPVSVQKPGLVSARRVEIIDPAEFYAGCYARVSLHPFAYEGEKKGVSFGLDNIQKLRDGEPIGRTRRSAEADFGAAEDVGTSESADSVFS